MTKPYAQQVVLCPHVYGPAVTHSTQGTTGQGLFQRLTASFGSLTQAGLQGPHGQKVHDCMLSSALVTCMTHHDSMHHDRLFLRITASFGAHTQSRLARATCSTVALLLLMISHVIDTTASFGPLTSAGLQGPHREQVHDRFQLSTLFMFMTGGDDNMEGTVLPKSIDHDAVHKQRCIVANCL